MCLPYICAGCSPVCYIIDISFKNIIIIHYKPSESIKTALGLKNDMK